MTTTSGWNARAWIGASRPPTCQGNAALGRRACRAQPGLECARQAREYDDYLQRKVEVGRASMHAGLGRSNDEVEASFAARRRQVAAGQA